MKVKIFRDSDMNTVYFGIYFSKLIESPVSDTDSGQSFPKWRDVVGLDHVSWINVVKVY